MLLYTIKAESDILQQLGLESKGYILATVHRAENTDNPLRLGAIFRGLMEVGGEIPVVLPLHPRTRKALERENLLLEASENLRLIEPVGYLDMVHLEKNSRLIATDSGGIQKEAFFYRVSCITLREETEWVELVESGWNILVPPFERLLVAKEIRLALNSGRVEKSSVKPYGTGQSASLIARILIELIR